MESRTCQKQCCQQPEVDLVRRKFLQDTLKAFGAVGFFGALYPFFASMLPSVTAAAAGAPITVDLSKLQDGEQKTVVWRGKPIWIIKRRPEVIAALEAKNLNLRDPGSQVPQQPKYAENIYRSIQKKYLVLVGVCTHLGCAPTYRPDAGAVDLGSDWPGGFFCACHGSKFDMSGRVFKGVPAPTNLEVPPHKFLDENTIVIGEEAI